MRTGRLDEMKRGWFVGNFEPSLLRTGDVEVAVKTYRAGDEEQKHYHKIATEITAVVSGSVEMNGKLLTAGDIVVVEPGETATFRSLTDAVNVVVKIPGAKDDKYICEVN